MTEPRPFHRLFGLSWVDFFEGSDITVEMELDLSMKQQFVDVVITRKGDTPLPQRLPDGFDNLGRFNLVTFKSYQETLDWWAMCELIGHLVNHRKQHSPSTNKLLPPSDFRLYAVSARYPNSLSQQIEMTPLSPGVYEIEVLTLRIRIIVVSQLPPEEQNAMLHLFSANKDLVRYGREHYSPHSKEISTILYDLLHLYVEDKNMSEVLKEYARQSLANILKSLTPEERLEGISNEVLLKMVPAEERLKGLTPEEVLKALPPELRQLLAQRLKNGDQK
jgi:hypothetical protein